jgi:hypothetical protein
MITQESPPAALVPVYERKRQRTTGLTKDAIEFLERNRKPISLASIVAVSRQIDPEARGVSENGIRTNPDAYKNYRDHMTWKRPSRKRARSPRKLARGQGSRDLVRARQRYLRLPKNELAERLIILEEDSVEWEQRWLRQADELLTWMIVASRLMGLVSCGNTAWR